MSKAYRAKLRAQSSDEVTSALGDLCETILHTRTDPRLGPLETIFAVTAVKLSGQYATLLNVAVCKNDAAYGTEEEMLKAIVKSAKDHKSNAAAKIETYLAVTAKHQAAEKAGLVQGPFRFIRLLKAAKQLGPRPA